MNQHLGQIGLVQYNNLMQNLLRYGVTADQLLQMSNNPYAVSAPVMNPAQNAGSYPQQQNVKQSTEVIAEHQETNDEGLLLKMFGTFCSEKPEDAKEMSIAFTKFARWMQSSVDKAK